MNRRSFLAILPGVLLAGMDREMGIGRGRGTGPPILHPEPRPGIDGSEVMSRESLRGFPESTLEIYDMIREIPHIADGIGCSCGCSMLPGYRSLLTCYYATGMAMGCQICQGQARLAYGRYQEGQSLDQIRRATDARFG